MNRDKKVKMSKRKATSFIKGNNIEDWEANVEHLKKIMKIINTINEGPIDVVTLEKRREIAAEALDRIGATFDYSEANISEEEKEGY